MGYLISSAPSNGSQTQALIGPVPPNVIELDPSEIMRTGSLLEGPGESALLHVWFRRVEKFEIKTTKKFFYEIWAILGHPKTQCRVLALRVSIKLKNKAALAQRIKQDFCFLVLGCFGTFWVLAQKPRLESKFYSINFLVKIS